MRRRMLDPEIWTDPKILKLEPIERLLFVGLITQADDDGRLRGEAETIKAKIFPVDSGQDLETIQQQIIRLDNLGLITYYQIKSEHYIQLNQWEKHQILRSDRKKDSLYPSNADGQPSVNQVSTNSSRSKVKGSKEKLREVSIICQAKNILKHLNLKAKTHFQENDVNLGFIMARLKEKGTTEEICIAIIDLKTYQWLEKPTQEGTEPIQAEYLRPATLFNKTKFWQYQGQVIVYMEKQVEKNLLKKRYQQDSERDPTPEEIRRGKKFEDKLRRLKDV